jgi:hypothetical protein
MGYGDDIMSTAAVREVNERTGRLVSLGGGTSPYWSPVFENNPRIVPYGDRVTAREWVRDYRGRRPYIDYRRTTGARQCVISSFSPEPGELYFTDAERKRAAGIASEHGYFVIVEPHVKGLYSGPNKDWGWHNWKELTNDKMFNWLQVSAPGKPSLPGVCRAPVDSIRDAFALIELAGAVVTTEGAFHHAAAALGTPAVVIWGGRTHPSVLGYPNHENLYVDRPGSPCGMNRKCAHCRACMDSIEPGAVMASLLKLA